jgi:hypothetical protein
MKPNKMIYITGVELAYLATTRTVGEVVEIALTVLQRMPQPVRWVAGPITSGERTPEENRKRLHRTILRYKEGGAVAFNYLPLQRRVMQILSRAKSANAQERLRDEFYAPIFKSGKIAELRIMPDSGASLNVHWMWGFARASDIPIRFIPEELVPE